MRTPVPKDPAEYQAKVFAGLTARSLAALAVGLALALAVAICASAAGLPPRAAALPAMAVVTACFIAGYAEPYGLPLADALPVLVDAATGPSVLLYESRPALGRREREAAAEAAFDKCYGKRTDELIRKKREYAREKRKLSGCGCERYLPLLEEARREIR